MVVLGILSYKVFPARFGGQNGVADFYNFFSKENSVVLVTSTNNLLKDIPLSNAHNFLFNQWTGYLNLIYLPRLVKLIAKQKVDVILLEHSYFGWLGILLRFFTGKPFVIHSHNIESHRFKISKRSWWRLYGYYEAWVHQKANFSFFISEADKNWGIQEWRLNPKNCSVITYGTHMQSANSTIEKINSRNILANKYSFKKEETIFLFNGSFNYEPNIECLLNITTHIIPLLNRSPLKYRILICGDHLSNDLKSKLNLFPEIIYTGYVPDMNLYTRAADAFIIPATMATGIKTKLIDALANNLTIISTAIGLKGLDLNGIAEKVKIINNKDWPTFAQQMICIKEQTFIDTPSEFYHQYYWGSIVKKASLILQTL